MWINRSLLLTITLLLITIAALNYSVLYYLGIDIREGIVPNLVNLFSSFCILAIGIAATFSKRKIIVNDYTGLFVILISYTLLVSFIKNSPFEYIPSLIRFSLYFLLMVLAYNVLKVKGLEYFIKVIKVFLVFNVIFAVFFGYLEVLLGEVQFLNGAYRYSGTFKYHQLGNAMYLVVLIVLWFELFVFPKKSLLNILVLLMLSHLFVNTHSRMLFVVFLFTYCLYYLFGIKSFVKWVKITFTIGICLLGVYLAIIHTEISPRLKTVFLSEKSLKDASTNERLEIIENTFEHMIPMEVLFGIGLGGFNSFYEEATGKPNFAAHNNFLLFFTEGGLVGLILFFLYQIAVFLALFRLARKRFLFQRKNLSRLLFVVIFIFEIGSFLLNNYYFFCSQSIVWIFIGMHVYLTKNTIYEISG